MEFVTIMVNNGRPLTLPSATRLSPEELAIAGPCYLLSEVKRVLKEHGTKCINVITKDCDDELHDYFMDAWDLEQLIRALKTDDYHNSCWCKGSPKSPWFAADAYRIRTEEKDPTGALIKFRYYLKFAIGRTGAILLFFSVHRDEK